MVKKNKTPSIKRLSAFERKELENEHFEYKYLLKTIGLDSLLSTKEKKKKYIKKKDRPSAIVENNGKIKKIDDYVLVNRERNEESKIKDDREEFEIKNIKEKTEVKVIIEF